MNAARGAIRNPGQAQVLRDFTGLLFERGITPTDVDGYVEFGDKVFIFIESKYKSSNISGGQKLALERLVDAVAETKAALLIVCSHDVSPGDGRQIDFANAKVTSYRHKKEWHFPKIDYTVKRLIDHFKRNYQ
jgi:KaiC/GvpD/RAD55 family RecA-like ATPase